jgi:hypothetical protein
MFTRIVVPLECNGADHAALDIAQDRARLYDCPIHLIRFVDVSHLVRIGGHGPTLDLATCRTTLPAEHATAKDYVTAVANALTARGFQVTHEIRQGLLRFELPAALRPGDLVVTTIESNPGAIPQQADIANDPNLAAGGMVVIIVGPNQSKHFPQITIGHDFDECESVELPRRDSARIPTSPSTRR